MNEYLILGLVFSVLLNFIIVIMLFATKIGKELIQRFNRIKKYKKGFFVNSLFLTKDGLLKELFIKRDKDNKFNYNDNVYTTNPKLLFHYKDIPTYLHLEGQPLPLDVYNNSDFNNMSCNELDEIMLGEHQFNLIEWLVKNSTLILLVVLIFVGLLVANTYFSYMSYQTFRDSAAKPAAEVAKSFFIGGGLIGLRNRL